MHPREGAYRHLENEFDDSAVAAFRALIGRLQRLPALAAALLILASFPAQSRAHESSRAAGAVNRAIDRGLTFLSRDAVAWKTEHDCASCHHAALIVWSMNEAKGRGFAVDESVLADLTRGLTAAGDGKSSQRRPPGIPKALNAKALYFALGLDAIPTRNNVQRDALKLLLDTVKGDQTANGSWAAWPQSLPPILGPSDETATELASLALLPAAHGGDPVARGAIDNAIKWLDQTSRGSDLQATTMRLLLWIRDGRPRSEWFPLVRRIKDRQKSDGGWSQTVDGRRDGWATGQALYVLSEAGLTKDEATIRLGRAFLVKTQNENGSWSMVSRPSKPGGTAADSFIPITGAGTAWAVMGLVRSGK